MSHYLEQEMSITDLDVLKKTLDKLGYNIKENVKELGSRYYSEKYKCDFGIAKNGEGDCVVGFKKDKENIWRLVGDPYPKQIKTMSQEIGLAYGENKVDSIVRKNSGKMKIAKKQKNKAGELEITVEVS